MVWTLTGDLDEYFGAAGAFLRSRPADHTILLTAAETLRARGPAAFGSPAPLFGWWREPGGPVSAAFLHTPPYGIALTAAPASAAAALAGALADRGRFPSGVTAEAGAGAAFAAAWQARTGQPARPGIRSRLYRLGQLLPPDPAPPGRARVAGPADLDLLRAWLDAFHEEADPGAPPMTARVAADRLSYGGLTLWQASDGPASMAGATRPAAGQVRIGPVYTPPQRRGRGFGGAVTAAVSRAAREAGVAEVLLFADLANPTSNALYQRLGFCPVSDRVQLFFTPAR
jgi:GNAT superfamily N-acetyltransferase